MVRSAAARKKQEEIETPEIGCDFHLEKLIAEVEQSWLTSLRNNLADRLLSHDPPIKTNAAAVAQVFLPGSQQYLQELLAGIRQPWWKSLKENAHDLFSGSASPRFLPTLSEPGDLGETAQHIRRLMAELQQPWWRSIAGELRDQRESTRLHRSAKTYVPPRRIELNAFAVALAVCFHVFGIIALLVLSLTRPRLVTNNAAATMVVAPYYTPEVQKQESAPKVEEIAPIKKVARPKASASSRPVIFHPLEPTQQPGGGPFEAVVNPARAQIPQLMSSLPAFGVAAPWAGRAESNGSGNGSGQTGGESIAGGPGTGSASDAASSTALAPQRVRVSQLAPHMLVADAKPVYPRNALFSHVHGDVVLAAIIGRDGRVKELRVIAGHPMLVGAAINAVRQRQYKPTLLNGQPVEVETEITIKFELN